MPDQKTSIFMDNPASLNKQLSNPKNVSLCYLKPNPLRYPTSEKPWLVSGAIAIRNEINHLNK